MALSDAPSEGADASHYGAVAHRAATAHTTAAQPAVWFDRRELGPILSLYGRMVAAGEWRDYALDGLADRAVFSIYRRTSEVPLYRIEKNPALARKQGAYSVITATGQILKRGKELAQVLTVFDKKRFQVVD